MPTHIIYIDDSGTKEYADDPNEYDNSRSGKSRYFVFGGLLVTPLSASRLSNDIVHLKIGCFGTKDVEIKSHWVRRPEHREKRYLDRYNISERRFRQFIDDYYKLINETELSFLAGVVDKRHMQEKYSFNLWYAPAVAFEVLMQRVENELRNIGNVTIVVDDMTGATPKGNQYRKNLINHHMQLRKHGSALMRGFNFTSLGSLRFLNSAQSHLIQVADIAAYNVNRQFIDFGEEWETRGITELPTYSYLERIITKFRKDSNGRVQGYGIAKFPMLERIPWKV